MGAFISAVVNVVGWIANHQFSRKRQREADCGKKVDECKRLIRDFRDASYNYWLVCGDDPRSKPLEDQIYRLTQDYLGELESLKDRFSGFSHINGLSLKKSATSGDFGSVRRQANDGVRVQVQADANLLISALDRDFNSQFR